MLNVFNSQKKGELNANNSSENLWLQLVSPSQDELEKIKEVFLIPDFLLDIHSVNKITPRLIRYADLFAFAVEIPTRNKAESKLPFSISKFSIIVTGNTVITLSEAEHPIFEILTNEYHDPLVNFSVTTLICHIFELINQLFSNAFSEINKVVDHVEKQLKVSIKNKQVFDLLHNNKSYLYFVKALKKNNVILNEITNKRLLLSDYNTDMQIMDIEITTHQLHKKIEIYQANLRNLMDAYSAAIENNLSLAVQYLTIFVTIASIPMAIAGIFGMNIPLPFQEETYALPVLAGVTFIIAAMMLVVFKIRRLI